MDIYISYSLHDKFTVDNIISTLKSNGHRVYNDSIKINTGDNVFRKIKNYINKADAVLVIVSKYSLNSKKL